MSAEFLEPQADLLAEEYGHGPKQTFRLEAPLHTDCSSFIVTTRDEQIIAAITVQKRHVVGILQSVGTLFASLPSAY